MKKKFKVNYSILFLFIIISAVVCSSCDDSEDQNYNFTGTVYNENGIALPGVSVTVFSDPKTYSTDSDGNFALNVSETVHTLLVSETGYSDIFKVVEIPGSGTYDQPVMLKDFPVTTLNVLARSGELLISNSINNKFAKLDIPAQSSGTFEVGSETGLGNADIGVEYIDVSMPLPVPLPSTDTLDAADVLIGEKQAPNVLVSVKPALLKMKTPATLTLPNPYDLSETRILRFDPYTGKWKNTGFTDNTPVDGTEITVTEGGIYGIFYEEPKAATVKGTAVPGSLIFVGDEVVKVTSSGTFNVKVPVPPDGSVDISGFDPETSRISTCRDQNIEPDKIITVNFLIGTEPAVFTIGRTTASVKSDNSDTSIITAVVMDEDRAPVEGAVVRFNASGGYISAATVMTDSEGKAEMFFSAGTDRAQLVEITATIDGVPKLGSHVIHVQITETEDQTYNFTGTVYNENGVTLPGVSVTVFSNPKTYSTDSDGNFALNVSETVHTLLVSETGYSDIFKVVEIPRSGTYDQPVMLKDFPVTTLNVLARSGKLLFSNSINNKLAKLDIPAQSSGTFEVGSETGLGNADIGVEYIDVSMPLPVPLPSPDTLDAADVIIGEKQAPSVLVSVKPALLKMKTPATLILPNPYDLIYIRILKFDPYTGKWKDTGVRTDDTLRDGTIINVTDGGIYGIFYEEPRTATVKGTAVPGFLIFVGDEVVKVTSNGTFYVKVPVPHDYLVDISGFDPETGRMSTRWDQNIEPYEILTVNFLFETEPAVFTIGRTTASVRSDNSDTSTITAVVMDEDRAPVEGAVVRFNASDGYISVATVVTDSEGKAETVFSSGTDRANQLVEITAIIDGVPRLGSQVIHVQITGTEILLSPDRTNLEKAEMTVRLMDAAKEPIENSKVVFATLDPGTLVRDDNIRLNIATAEGYNNFYTGYDGVLKVTVTGVFYPGDTGFNTLLMVESSGAKATQLFVVTSGGDEFKIVKVVSRSGKQYE